MLFQDIVYHTLTINIVPQFQLHKQIMVIDYHACKTQVRRASRQEFGNEFGKLPKGFLLVVHNCPIQHCMILNIRFLGEVGELLLRSYSRGNGSKGLRPQLVHCAPFPSIALYFRMLYVSYPKIRMAVVTYPKVRTTIVWYPGIEESNVFLSEDKE